MFDSNAHIPNTIQNKDKRKTTKQNKTQKKTTHLETCTANLHICE